MLEKREIKNSTAIITGAASGMGGATAQLFAEAEANIVLTDIDQNACDNAAAEIIKIVPQAQILPLALDVKSRTTQQVIIEATIKKFNKLDILINNAGLSTFTPIDSENYDEAWQKSLDIMLSAQQQLIRLALPYLRKSPAGRIINIASTEGLGATKGNSAYVVAKHGVVGLTRALAVELGADGITVNCVCPGPINTGITKNIADEHKIIFAKRRTALRRYGEPEEVAHITMSLALPAASYITGAIIPVDGGLTARTG